MRTETTQYDKQAKDFLERFGLSFRATVAPEDFQRPAPWSDGKKSGLLYRVTISRTKNPACRIAFDFWGSIHDREIIELGENLIRMAKAKPSAYAVLAHIACDAPDVGDFDEFCRVFGEDHDSRRAFATWERVRLHSKKLRGFFTAEELEALAEIQ